MRDLSVWTVRVAVLAAVLWAHSMVARKPDSVQAAPPESALEHLMQLSAEGAAFEPNHSHAVNELLARCREQILAARSYRSWLVKRDFSLPHLRPRNFAYVEWQFDFVGPDRLRVRQVIHEKEPLGELRDERVSLGEEHYVQAGSWMRADQDAANDFAEMNRFLRLDKFTEVLRNSKFAFKGAVRSGERIYELLETDNARLGSFAVLSEFVDLKCQARLWIEEATGVLAKVELIYRGKDPSGKPLYKTFDQVFADYNNQALSIDLPLVKP